MGKQKCISEENGRNFSKYDEIIGMGTRKKQGYVLFMFLRQISVFQCEISATDKAEFNIFLCPAEHPVPNSDPNLL